MESAEVNPRIEMPEDVHDKGLKLWDCALIAQFQKFINLMWGNGEELELRFAEKNLFVVVFPNVLERGPWFIQNHMLTVRKWTSNLKNLNFDTSKVPV